MGPSPSPSTLTRYGSAPGSLLTSAVDSVIGAGAEREFSALRPQPSASFIGRYFSSGDGDSSSLTSESTFKVNSSKETAKPLLRSYGLGEMAAAAIGSSSSSSSSTSCSSSAALVRQRSSPAGFLSHLTDNNGTPFPFVFLLSTITVMSLLNEGVVTVVGSAVGAPLGF